MTTLLYIGQCLGIGIMIILMILIMVLFIAFSKALAVKMAMGVWPHEDPEAMEVWKEMP